MTPNTKYWTDTGPLIENCCYNVDGQDYWASFPYGDVYNTSALGFAAWIKVQVGSPSTQGILGKFTDNSPGTGYVFFLGSHAVGGKSGAINWTIGGPGGYFRVYGETDLRDGSWHHVAGTMDRHTPGDASNCKVYVDGVDDTYDTETDNGLDNVGSLSNASGYKVGTAFDTDDHLYGKIRDVIFTWGDSVYDDSTYPRGMLTSPDVIPDMGNNPLDYNYYPGYGFLWKFDNGCAVSNNEVYFTDLETLVTFGYGYVGNLTQNNGGSTPWETGDLPT